MIINKYILYIYLIHGKYCSATKGFMKFITTFIRQLRRWNEIENRKFNKIHTKIENVTKCRQKAVKISFMCGYAAASVMQSSSKELSTLVADRV